MNLFLSSNSFFNQLLTALFQYDKLSLALSYKTELLFINDLNFPIFWWFTASRLIKARLKKQSGR